MAPPDEAAMSRRRLPRIGSDKCSAKAASAIALASATATASCLKLQIRKVFAIYAQV